MLMCFHFVFICTKITVYEKWILFLLSVLDLKRILVFWGIMLCQWVSGSQHSIKVSGTAYLAKQCHNQNP
jgi:hypothetical protein